MGKGERWLAPALFGALCLVYWHGRSLSFGAGDSPQHALSALTWGVSFRPGYPLYNLAGFLLARLPWGPPAGIISGFSGFCHAAAAAVLFLLMRRLGAVLAAALTPAALLAFSPLFWYYSEIAEVRALNDLLAVLAAYCSVRHAQTRTAASLAGLAAALGLGLSHHPTFVLILPAAAFWLWRQRALPTGRRAAAFGAAVLGFCALPYVLLGVRLHLCAPAYNPMDVRTWGDVARLFLRSDAGGLWRAVSGQGLFGPGGCALLPLAAHCAWAARAFLDQAGWPGVLLSAAGAAWLAARRRDLLGFWGLWVLVGLAPVLVLFSQQQALWYPEYTRAEVARFYLMPFLGLFACAGFAVQGLCEAAGALPAWALALGLAVPLAAAPVELRGRDPLLRYGEDVLASSGPRDIILLYSDDLFFALEYLDHAAHRAGDRVFLKTGLFGSAAYARALQRRHPDLRLPPRGPRGLSTDWRAWLRLNPGRRLFAEALYPEVLRGEFPGLSPQGALAAALDRPPPPRALAAQARRFLDTAAIARLRKADLRTGTPEIHLVRQAGSLLAWYASLLDRPQDAVLRAEMLRRLEAL